MKKYFISLLIFILLFQTGCSLLFGNIRSEDEKSTTYRIADLSKTNPDWLKLDPKSINDTVNVDGNSSGNGVSDVLFQSQKTASIISMNSTCRTSEKKEERQSLRELSRELLLGISDITSQVEKSLTLQNTKALQTTIKGKMNHEEMTLRTIVLQYSHCIYDLMYVTRPEHFEENESDFNHFADSLRLK